MSDRRAPVQGDPGWWGPKNRKDKAFDESMPPGSISWEEHLEAWQGYHKEYPGIDQDAEKIASRGGFGHEELRSFLGREPLTFVVDPALKAQWSRYPGIEYGQGYLWK